MSDSNNSIIPIAPSTIETIDYAFYNWLDKSMDLHSRTEEGWKKVPITWISAERAHQIKSNKDIRDSSGMIKLPLMTIERKSIVQDPTKTGSIPANIRRIGDEKDGAITIARRINQEKTSNFVNAAQTKKTTLNGTEVRNVQRRDNKVYPLYDNRTQRQRIPKVVYQTITIPIPVHVVVTYQVYVRTDYLQQLNEITTPFITKNGNTRYVKLSYDQHNYDAFIKGDFAYENNASSLNEERKNYSSSITIEVIGYLVGEGDNSETPKIILRENAVEIGFPRERVMLGDQPDFVNTSKNKTSYRE